MVTAQEPPAAAPARADGTATAAAEPKRWLALAVLALVQFTIVIDTTVVNVALPTVGRELGLAPTGLAWVVNGYLLTAGGLLLLGGRLSDVAGRRRMFLLGTALFGLASLSCALAPTGVILMAARFVQGAGEALASPAALSIIALLFRNPGERAKALGVWGGLAGLGATVGVLLSGVLTDLAGWRWLFVINLPFAAVALLVVPRLVAPDRDRAGGRLDLPGAVLVTGGATAVVSALLAAAEHTWASPTVLVPFGAGLAMLAGFVAVEARSPAPLVPLRFFTDRTRVCANLASVFLIGVMAAMFLLLTLYMQNVLGYSALRTGLAYLPFCVVFVAGIGLAVPLLSRLGVRTTMLAAFLVATAGMLLLTRLPVAADYSRDLLPALLVLAVGFGMAFPGLQTAALHGVSEADAGLASGVQIAVQALANALGIAVFLTLALRHAAGLADLSAPAALTEGYQLAFGAGVISLLIGFSVMLLMPRTSGH
jgi:EmrB/QacA subfamily drug resistance transporter